MRVLITGGAGFIGSVIGEQLVRGGHEVVVYDSLVKGHLSAIIDGVSFIQADLNDDRMLSDTFKNFGIEAVIHLAAYCRVGESLHDPAKYYRNNLVAGLTLLDAMQVWGGKRIVYSSTAAVYGDPQKQPVEEGDPTCPTNPYGQSKLSFERALGWYGRAYGLRYAVLRCFNAAGATRRCGESHEPETHLIPTVLQAASGRKPFVEIYGDDYPTRDGTCVRDYVHVSDIARAHVMALEALDERSEVYNIGCGGEGYTVLEVIRAASEVTGLDIPFQISDRRRGDAAALVASNEKIKREIGWEPALQDLHKIIASAWMWALERPSGYENYGLSFSAGTRK
jgi:UDP-glucose 4-epimerase